MAVNETFEKSLIELRDEIMKSVKEKLNRSHVSPHLEPDTFCLATNQLSLDEIDTIEELGTRFYQFKMVYGFPYFYFRISPF